MAALLTTRAGIAGALVLLALLFYEGVPLVNKIPYLDRVPLIAEFGVGRVEIERRKAVRAERAAWETRIKELELQAATLRAEKADEIAEIERELLQDRIASFLELQKLQETIDELEHEEPAGDPACPPALRKRLSEQLDAIGRHSPADR